MADAKSIFCKDAQALSSSSYAAWNFGSQSFSLRSCSNAFWRRSSSNWTASILTICPSHNNHGISCWRIISFNSDWKSHRSPAESSAYWISITSKRNGVNVAAKWSYIGPSNMLCFKLMYGTPFIALNLSIASSNAVVVTS